MIGVIIVSHGKLAMGLIDALYMIIGEQEAILPVVLDEGESPEQLESKLEEALDQIGSMDGILILTDLFGATPFNVSGRIYQAHDHVEVIAGYNLPMLIELVMERDGASLHKLSQVAKNAGVEGVRVLSDALENGDL